MRRSAPWGALLAGVLLVAGVACGSGEAEVNAGGGTGLDDPEQQESWEHRRGDLMGFAEAISTSPYWASMDRELPFCAADMTAGAIAVVRAEVTGLEIGPLITTDVDRTLQEVSDGLKEEMGPQTPTGFRTATVAIGADVVSSDSETIAPGTEVRVLVPVLTVVSDDIYAPKAEDVVQPLLDHDVAGLEVLVAVGEFDESGTIIPASGGNAVLMGLPDGSAAVLLSTVLEDGQMWGTSDLTVLESAMDPNSPAERRIFPTCVEEPIR